MKFTIQSGKAPPKKASAHRNQEIMLLVTSAAEVISTLRDGQFFVVEGSKGLKGGRCGGIVRNMNRAIKQAGREGGVIAYSSDDGVVVKHVPSGIEGEDDAPRAPAAQPASSAPQKGPKLAEFLRTVAAASPDQCRSLILKDIEGRKWKWEPGVYGLQWPEAEAIAKAFEVELGKKPALEDFMPKPEAKPAKKKTGKKKDGKKPAAVVAGDEVDE